MGIRHDEVKATGNRGYAAEWNAAHVIRANVDFRYYAAENMRIENRTDWPAGPAAGRIIYRTDLNALYVWDGTAWIIAAATQTRYLAIPACAFVSGHPATDNVVIYNAHSNEDQVQYFRTLEAGRNVFAPIHLPDGAVVTECIVYGNAAAQAATWELLRLNHVGTADVPPMATANMQAADNTINDATIDNENFLYTLVTDVLAINSEIYGARLIYTY